jgi:hypothetical protein
MSEINEGEANKPLFFTYLHSFHLLSAATKALPLFRSIDTVLLLIPAVNLRSVDDVYCRYELCPSGSAKALGRVNVKAEVIECNVPFDFRPYACSEVNAGGSINGQIDIESPSGVTLSDNSLPVSFYYPPRIDSSLVQYDRGSASFYGSFPNVSSIVNSSCSFSTVARLPDPVFSDLSWVSSSHLTCPIPSISPRSQVLSLAVTGELQPTENVRIRVAPKSPPGPAEYVLNIASKAQQQEIQKIVISSDANVNFTTETLAIEVERLVEVHEISVSITPFVPLSVWLYIQASSALTDRLPVGANAYRNRSSGFFSINFGALSSPMLQVDVVSSADIQSALVSLRDKIPGIELTTVTSVDSLRNSSILNAFLITFSGVHTPLPYLGLNTHLIRSGSLVLATATKA